MLHYSIQIYADYLFSTRSAKMGKAVKPIIIGLIIFVLVGGGYLYLEGKKHAQEDQIELNKKLQALSDQFGNKDNKIPKNGEELHTQLQQASEELNAMAADFYAESEYQAFDLKWADLITQINKAGISDKDYILSEIKGKKIVKNTLKIPSKDEFKDALNPTEVSIYSPIDKPGQVVAIEYNFNPDDASKQTLRNTLSNFIFGSDEASTIMAQQEAKIIQAKAKQDGKKIETLSIDESAALKEFTIDSSLLQGFDKFSVIIGKKPVANKSKTSQKKTNK